MIFPYRCPNHGEFEMNHRVGEAPSADYCPDCLNESPRIFTAPLFQEDRVRFYRRNDGTRYSSALGEDMPDSRRDAERLAKSKGIEFMTRDEVPSYLKFAKEYGAHLKRGGERLDNGVAAQLMSPPSEPAPTLVETLRKKAPRLGEIPTDRLISGKPLPAFPKDVVLD
jgi:hypothetical protein